MVQIKKLVVEEGDRLLTSQADGYETLKSSMQIELQPLQDAKNAAKRVLDAANQNLTDAQIAKDNAQATYDAAVTAYDVQAVDYTQVVLDIADLTDQSAASQRLFAFAQSRNLLDVTSPK